MEAPAHKVEVITNEWPSQLATLDDAAQALHISTERLRGLADGGYAPHWRIDGGEPFFKISELKRWAANNLVEYVAGRSLPQPIRVVLPAERITDFRKVPIALREVVGLCDITHEILRTGIYFLCRGGMAVYVGQSGNVASRIGEHYKSHDFDSALFLPWPKE